MAPLTQYNWEQCHHWDTKSLSPSVSLSLSSHNTMIAFVKAGAERTNNSQDYPAWAMANVNFYLEARKVWWRWNCFYELLRQSSYFKINWPWCRSSVSVKLKGRAALLPVPGPMHPWLDYTCLVASQECKIWRHYDTTTISSIYTYYYKLNTKNLMENM